MGTFSEYIGKHSGQSALVCGCGPSVLQFGIDFYDGWDGPTYGANSIRKLFVPTYYFNLYDLADNMMDTIRGERIKFAWCEPSKTKINPHHDGLCISTIGLTMISAAYRMGCSEINIIGIDMCADDEGRVYFYGGKEPGRKHYFPIVTGERNHESGQRDKALQHISNIDRAIEMIRSQGVTVNNLSRISRVTQ